MFVIRRENATNFLFHFFIDLILGRTKIKNIKTRFTCVRQYLYYIYIANTGDIIIVKRRNDNTHHFKLDYNKYNCVCKKCNSIMVEDDIIKSLESGICIKCNKKFKVAYLNDSELRINKIKSFL